MYKKKASPKSSTIITVANNTNDEQPCKLNTEELTQVLNSLPSEANQARRMTAYLAKHPNATTAQVNIAAAAVNLSDVAIKYNPYILKHGFKLACKTPPKPINNRFGERTSMYLWGLYRITGSAANDSK